MCYLGWIACFCDSINWSIEPYEERLSMTERLVMRISSGLMILVLIFVLSTAYSPLGYNTHGYSNLGPAIAVFALAVLLFWLFGKLGGRRFPCLLFVVSFLCYALLISLNNNPQISDFAYQIDSARSFLAGNTRALQTSYFTEWPDTLGYTLIEMMLLSISDRVIVIKFFECACSSGMLVIAYFLMRSLSSERLARTGSALLGLFPLFVLTNESANNQVLSAFLSLLAIWVVARAIDCEFFGRRLALYAIVGAIVAFSKFVRPDALLIFLGLLIFIVVRNGNDLKSQCAVGDCVLASKLVEATVFCLTFLCAGAILSLGVSCSGVTADGPTGEHVTINKIVMGLDTSSGGRCTTGEGGYRDRIEKRMEAEGIPYNVAAVREMKDGLSSPDDIIDLAISKTRNLWWDYPFTFSLTDESETIKQWVYGLDKAMVALLCVTCLISFCVVFHGGRRRVGKNILYPIILMAFLTIGAYSIIEVQPRYLYFMYILMFVLSTYGIQEIFDRLKETSCFVN